MSDKFMSKDIKLPEKSKVKCKICKFLIYEGMQKPHIEIAHKDYFFVDHISEGITKYFEPVDTIGDKRIV